MLGLDSMFNHSVYNQNIGWERNIKAESVTYRASQDIKAGEELCINYSRLWFVDSDVDQNPGAGDGLDDLARVEI